MNINNLEKYLKKNNPSDLVIRKIQIKKTKILYVFLESVSNDDKISNFFMKDILISFNNKIKDIFYYLKNTIPNSHLTIESNLNDLFYKLSSGYTCIFIENELEYISIETKSNLDRGVTESTSETIIRGPKDSFTENNSINLGLIRKRIKDKNLIFNEIKIGKRTKTKVTVSYISDIANKNSIKKIREKLKKINIDGILDSGYIRDFLIEKTNLFPKIKSTERPDLACIELLNGKIIILVENSPFVLIMPCIMADYLTATEDFYQKTSNVNFNKILRLISFILTIITPGIYVAITTFNQEIIPDELLISLSIQREGVPFPTSLEVFMMITTFEILRESDIRLPSKMGAAISIVGALVLGEAAVSAGIVSPIVIIVVAITSICGLLFTDIDFVNAIRWWRLIFLLFGTIAGIIGILFASIIFINNLSTVTILDVPYLTPISPLYLKELYSTLLKKRNNKKRPSYLTKNIKKAGD